MRANGVWAIVMTRLVAVIHANNRPNVEPWVGMIDARTVEGVRAGPNIPKPPRARLAHQWREALYGRSR